MKREEKPQEAMLGAPGRGLVLGKAPERSQTSALKP